MPQTDDPMMAMLIERVEHIAKGIDEMRPMISTIPSIERDLSYHTERLDQLNEIAKDRGREIHELDKRILKLERWYRAMLAAPAILVTLSISVGGYAMKFKEDTDRRVSSLEFILNSPHYERAMDRDHKEDVEGGKD